MKLKLLWGIPLTKNRKYHDQLNHNRKTLHSFPLLISVLSQYLESTKTVLRSTNPKFELCGFLAVFKPGIWGKGMKCPENFN